MTPTAIHTIHVFIGAYMYRLAASILSHRRDPLREFEGTTTSTSTSLLTARCLGLPIGSLLHQSQARIFASFTAKQPSGVWARR